MKESRSCLFPLIASFYLILLLRQNGVVSAFTLFRSAPCNGIQKEMRTSSWLKSSSDIPSYDAEVVDDGEQDDNFDWTPDSEKVRLAQESRFKAAEATPADFYGNSSGSAQSQQSTSNDKSQEKDEVPSQKKKRLTYTDEEEELIELLGGKDANSPSPKREQGFLGDCTLKEIALDYQVPICYLGDVLCGWGVPPPIDPDGMLGDMVTGEQAFAILEAIHTLDMGALNERYADYDLVTLCNEYGVEMTDGFELAMKEGWNLPFGVRTFLKVEQEEHLIETLAKDVW